MRIRVKDVLEMLGAGASEAEILADFPDLQVQDIRACLQYAAAQVNHAVLQTPTAASTRAFTAASIFTSSGHFRV